MSCESDEPSLAKYISEPVFGEDSSMQELIDENLVSDF